MGKLFKRVMLLSLLLNLLIAINVMGQYEDVLVLDLDPVPSSGPELSQILQSMGYSVAYETAITGLTLEEHTYVYVCLGINFDNFVLETNSPEELALTSYLDHGGKLFVEGGDVGYDEPENLWPYFHANYENDGEGDLSSIIGEEGTITEDMQIEYAGPNNFIDRISAQEDAVDLFYHHLEVQTETAGCGVIYDGGHYKTAVFTFEVGLLEDDPFPNNRQTLLTRLMNFFGPGIVGPYDLSATVNHNTGLVSLAWFFDEPDDLTFTEFHLYRDGTNIYSGTDLSYQDQLPTFGNYVYSVTANYVEDNAESRHAVTPRIAWLEGGPLPPFAFSLLGPIDQSQFEEFAATFSWYSTDDPNPDDIIEYSVELAFEDSFSDPLIYEVGLDTTVIITHLVDDSTYFWRIHAVDGNSPNGTYSTENWSFSISHPDPPLPFNLTSPINFYHVDYEEIPTTPFEWEASIDPDPNDPPPTYSLFVTARVGFEEIEVVVPSIATNSYLVDVPSLYNLASWDRPMRVTWMVRAFSNEDSVDCITSAIFYIDPYTNTSLETETSSLPNQFAIESIYPNPFNASTRIRIGLPEQSELKIDIYDITGREVESLKQGVLDAGYHEITFNGERLSSGTYLVRASNGHGLNHIQRFTVIK
jgi:Secretion system C-terminal sorting domain